MQFAHLSDTHLGARQFDCDQREQDIYDVFMEAVESIVEDRVDFVLHTGDLFEHSKPPIKSMVVAKEGFRRLHDAGIPVFIIPGNHELPKRKGNVCPLEMYSDLMKIIYDENNIIEVGDVFIGGLAHHSRVFADQIHDRLARLTLASQGYQTKILMLHQGIKEHTFSMEGSYELGLDDLPTTFDYIALGHLHRHSISNHGVGLLAYPGSTEYMSVSEYDSCGDVSKGYLLVDTERDELDVQVVQLHTRCLVKEEVEVRSPRELIRPLGKLRVQINSMEKLPLIWLTVKHHGCDPRDVRDGALLILKDKAVYTRIDLHDLSEPANGSFDEVTDIQDILREMLKKKYNDNDAEFAVQLVDALSSGDEELAIRIATSYYGGREQ